MKFAAVIAAAGLSSRMREFKPMLCLGTMTIIERVIQNLRSAGTEEIVVVTGYKSELLEKHLASRSVRLCKNTHYAETKMLDSICLELKTLRTSYDAVFITPGDVPLVRTDTLRQMETAGAGIVRPVCGGQPGHPVLIAREYIPQILKYRGSKGLRGAMAALPQPVTDIEVDDSGITMDADTPQDFRALRRQEMSIHNTGQLWPDIHIHIAKGDTILTPETAQYLEMIGHTGSIQNACACMHMSYSRGWTLLNKMEKELGYPLVGRYAGGSGGGGSTLTPRGQQLLTAYQEYRDILHRAAEELFQKAFTADLNGPDQGTCHENSLSHPSR